MAHIPNEILVNITIYLRHDERFQCALVCRNWYFGLLNGNLYEHLQFTSTQQCRRAIKYFNTQSQSIQRKVTELKLICDYDATKLAHEFPNLEKLVWTDENFSFKDWIEPTFNGDFDKLVQNWKHIREITEANWHYPITQALLKLPETAHNLIWIDISFHERTYREEPDYCSNYHRARSFIPYLKNAKNLNFLRLNKIYLTLQDMEQIHSGTSRLSVIELKDIKISLNNTDQQTNIQNRYWKDVQVQVKQLCNRLTHLDIQLAHDLNHFEGENRTLTRWLRYISKKYTNLTDFHINVNSIDDNYAMELYYEKPLLACKAFSKWKNLTVLDMGIAPLTVALTKAMDSSKIQLKEITIYFTETSARTQMEAITKSKQKLSIESLNVKAKRSIHKNTYEGLRLVQMIRALPSLSELFLGGPCSEHGSRHGLYEDDLLLEILKQTSDNLLSLTCFGIFIANAEYDMFWVNQRVDNDEFPKTKLPFRSSLEDLNIVHCKLYKDKEIDAFNDTLAILLLGCPSLDHFQFTTSRTELTTRSFNNPSSSRTSSIELNLSNQPLLLQMEIDISGENIYQVIDKHDQQKWYLQHNYGEAFVEIPKPSSLKRKYTSLALSRSVVLNGATLPHVESDSCTSYLSNTNKAP
jgi:hypothetical protein